MSNYLPFSVGGLRRLSLAANKNLSKTSHVSLVREEASFAIFSIARRTWWHNTACLLTRSAPFEKKKKSHTRRSILLKQYYSIHIYARTGKTRRGSFQKHEFHRHQKVEWNSIKFIIKEERLYKERSDLIKRQIVQEHRWEINPFTIYIKLTKKHSENKIDAWISEYTPSVLGAISRHIRMLHSRMAEALNSNYNTKHKSLNEMRKKLRINLFFPLFSF